MIERLLTGMETGKTWARFAGAVFDYYAWDRDRAQAHALAAAGKP